MDDREPLALLIAGDPAAWGVFVRAHAALLHAAAVRALGSRGRERGVEAEDVVQAVFQKLWADGRRRLASFRGTSRLSTWLVAVTQREAFDRARVRTPPTIATGPGVDAPPARPGALVDASSRADGRAPASAEADAILREDRDAVDRALAVLPPRDRLLLRFVHMDGRSYGEVARLLAVPENSISPWLARARARLQALLAPPRTDSASRPL